MSRRLVVPVMVGSTVYEAGTDEADIVGADKITASGVWSDGDDTRTVEVKVSDSHEVVAKFEEAAKALEDAQAEIERLQARVVELEAGADDSSTGGDGSGDEKGAYDDLTVVVLKEEIDKRNEGRDDESKLSKSGDKAALVASLVADDEAQEN